MPNKANEGDSEGGRKIVFPLRSVAAFFAPYLRALEVLMSKFELKPCPFCGEMPRYDLAQSESLHSHAVVDFLSIGCSNCDFTFGSSEDWQSLVDKWNTRTSNNQD